MQAIPSAVQSRFEEHLRTKTISDHLQWSYKKWLRYYLDYCEKYHFSPKDRSSLPRFIGKLNEKKQTGQQQGQAAESINIYYEILSQEDMPPKAPLPQPIRHREDISSKDGKHVFLNEPPAIAIQHEKVIPAPFHASAPSSSIHSSSRGVSVSGMSPIVLQGAMKADSLQAKRNDVR